MLDVGDREVIQRQAGDNQVVGGFGGQSFHRLVQHARLRGDLSEGLLRGKSFVEPADELRVELHQVKPITGGHPPHDARRDGPRARPDLEDALALGLLADMACQRAAQKPAAGQHGAGGVELVAKLPPENPVIVEPCSHPSVVAEWLPKLKRSLSPFPEAKLAFRPGGG